MSGSRSTQIKSHWSSQGERRGWEKHAGHARGGTRTPVELKEGSDCNRQGQEMAQEVRAAEGTLGAGEAA